MLFWVFLETRPNKKIKGLDFSIKLLNLFFFSLGSKYNLIFVEIWGGQICIVLHVFLIISRK